MTDSQAYAAALLSDAAKRAASMTDQPSSTLLDGVYNAIGDAEGLKEQGSLSDENFPQYHDRLIEALACCVAHLTVESRARQASFN